MSDDLFSFRKVADQLQLEHQVCQFHLRRWVGRTLREFGQTIPEDWLPVVNQVQHLLDELPEDGGRSLFDLWKQIHVRHPSPDQPRPPIIRLRDLLIRLSENWPRFRLFDWQPDVPWTNNLTEQAAGRMKMRSRTVRGYKSWQGMWAALLLAGLGPSF